MGTDLTTTAMKYQSEEWLKSASKSDRRGGSKKLQQSETKRNQIRWTLATNNLQSNKSNPHAKTKAHLGDQAGISRGVHAPAAPGIAASSMPPCPRHPTRAACGRCVVRAPAREREREIRWGLSQLPPSSPEVTGERERSDGSLPAAPPSSAEVTGRERGKSPQG